MKHTDYLKKKKNREIRRRVVSILSAIVVFVATYALVLPALTLDVKTARMEPGMPVQQEADPEAVSAPEAPAEEEAVEESTKEEEPAEAVEPEKEEKSVKEESAKEDQSAQAEEQAPAEEASKDKADEAAQKEDAGQADADSAAADQAPAKNDSSSEAVDQSGADAAEENTKEAAAEAFKVPELEAIDFNEILTDKTDFYYYHADKDEDAAAVSSTDIDDWKKVTKDTVLAPEDFVRVYLAYTIPAGALNETNATASYRLPDGLELTDKQIKAINKNENGISGTDKDAKDYKKYLGAEAIEGTRTPDKTRGDDEYISATVKVEKVYKNDKYIGQELLFTFAPYTIQKNQISYEDKGNVKSEGKAVKGWFTFDLTPSRIGFEETEDAAAESGLVRSEAKITFVKENNKKDIDEISRALTLDAPAGTDADKTEEKAEQAAEQKTLTYEGPDYTVIINYTDGAEIPDNATLEVSEIGKDTPEYKDYLEQAKAAVKEDKEDKTVNEARFFDITIFADGEKVEPAAPVNVQINFAGIEQTKAEDAQLLHYKDDEVQVMDKAEFSKSEEAENEEKAVDTVQFEADGFSVYGIVGTGQIIIDYLTADGDTYRIKVTFDEREGLGNDVTLVVSELPEGSYSYNDYLQKAANELWLDSVDEIREARFFDIEIRKNGEKYEPVYPAKVSIQYADAIEVGEEQELSIIHFADEGTELITDVDLSEDGKELEYEQKSFSVSGTILANNSSNARASSMMLIVSSGGKYYAVDKDLALHEINANKFNTSGNTVVEFLENDFTFDDETGAANVDQLAPYLWGRDISTNNNHIQEYHNADGEYLQFYPNNGTYVEGYYPNGSVFTSKDVNTSASNTAILLSGNAIYQKVNNPGKWPGSSYTNTSKDFFLKIDNSGGTPTLTSFTDGNSSDRANVYFVKPNVVNGESGSEGGGGTPEDELGAPDTNKHLTVNGDGTYTLSLSVTGESKGATEAAPGDVLLVMDISNSMKSSDMQAAKDAAVQFSGTLLGNPDNNLKLALETYAKTVSFPGDLDGFTSNEAYFEAMVNTITSDGAGETNWDDALSKANSFFTNNGSGATAPKYVVFLTDGKPNAYGTGGTVESYNYPTESTKAYPPAEANALALKNSGAKIFIVAVESSESTQLEYNAMHQHVKKLARALFGDENAYYTADESTLIQILAQIAAEISKEYSYKNVTIEDGVTGGSVGTGVNGNVSNFTYTIKKKDGTTTTYYSDADLQAAYPGIGTASFSNGTVTWPLGDDYKLEDGTTYTVNFTVWPNQTAYDAIADIKNNFKSYAEVIQEHPELADTLTETGGYVTNKDNSAKVTYESYVTVTVGDTTTEERVGGGEVTMTNPDPQPLAKSSITVKKEWEWNLPGAEEPDNVTLGLIRDNELYLNDILLYKAGEIDPETGESTSWTATRYIAPGILLDEDQAQAHGLVVSNLKAVTYKTSSSAAGKTYYQINSGHDYQFTEMEAQGFELQKVTYHPMLVNGQLVNVTVSGTDADPIYTQDGMLNKLIATNVRRGGINISKEVLDPEGNEQPDDDTDFTVNVTLTAPSDMTQLEKDGDNFVAYYQYYVEDTETLVANDDPWLQNVIQAQGMSLWKGTYWGSLTFDKTTGIATGSLLIKQGVTIRFKNMAADTQYNVVEAAATGYEASYLYQHGEYNSDHERIRTTDDPGYDTDEHGNNYHDSDFNGTVVSDQAGDITVTNRITEVIITIKKFADDKTTGLNDAEFKLLSGDGHTTYYVHKTNNKVIDAAKYNTLSDDEKANYSDTFKIANGTTGIQLTLVPGEYKLVETNPPKGYIKHVDAVYFTVGTSAITMTQQDGVIITDPKYAEPDGRALKVYNEPGEALPNTGGPGTLYYTLSGLMLIFASALMYGFKMRRRERRIN